VKAELESLLDKGKRSLQAARRLYDEGDYDFSASRAYYAMFYLAEALLLSKGQSFSKHSAVISAFGQHFVKPGHFTEAHHNALHKAFDERNVGDYEYEVAFARERAKELLDKAGVFLRDAETFLRKT
jgi:uncharacterized protein (UPF0332 family)